MLPLPHQPRKVYNITLTPAKIEIKRKGGTTMTKTKNMNIRIAEDDYEAIKQFADFNGKSVSSLMLDAVWEQIEYWEDMKAVEEYEKEKANGTLVTVPWEQVKNDTGHDDEIQP